MENKDFIVIEQFQHEYLIYSFVFFIACGVMANLEAGFRYVNVGISSIFALIGIYLLYLFLKDKEQIKYFTNGN